MVVNWLILDSDETGKPLEKLAEEFKKQLDKFLNDVALASVKYE